MVMQTLRRCAIALVALAGSAVAAVPALADGGWATTSRSDYPSIWQGAYIGLHLGQGEAGSADGVVAGGQIGHNWQNGPIVFGLEADASYADISESFGPFEASIDFIATARGRLGYLVTPNILVYGTAGFGIVSASGSVGIPGLGSFSGDDTETDLVFGLGVEGKFASNMSARIEYLTFSDLNVDVVRVGLNFKLGNY
ncbi:MAG TPA: outer membrane beta-barrel protein [Hyphomicrobiaceae bacterium]|nr:outer membrane beta-barrel protein [Hyphomicrobiaceae bacterium]